MLKEMLKEIFERDIHKLIIELNSYNDEDNIWVIEGSIKNSAGNLCLHLIGNLKHFIGSILGGLEFKRDRDSEFSSNGIPRKEIVHELKETSTIVVNTLTNMTDEELMNDYPFKVFDKTVSTAYFMVHLTTHLNYHLGQVNYHRRLIDK